MATVTSPQSRTRFMAGRVAHALMGSILGALPACGDGLADAQYRGTPLITLRGNVQGASESLDPDNPLIRLSVWWSPQGPRSFEVGQLIEQSSIATESTVPFSFTLNVFDAPGVQHQVVQSDGSRYAIGALHAYRDTDGNGRHDSGELFAGSSPARVLIYAPKELSAAASPTGQRLQGGYSLVSTPIDCPPAPGVPRMPQPAPPTVGTDCTRQLGQPCTADSDCSPGVCVRDFMAPWPGGGCALPDPLPAGCAAVGAQHVAGGTRDGFASYWLKGCATHSDCGRSFPYQCDASVGACLPTQIMVVELADPPPSKPWCR